MPKPAMRADAAPAAFDIRPLTPCIGAEIHGVEDADIVVVVDVHDGVAGVFARRCAEFAEARGGREVVVEALAGDDIEVLLVGRAQGAV